VKVEDHIIPQVKWFRCMYIDEGTCKKKEDEE